MLGVLVESDHMGLAVIDNLLNAAIFIYVGSIIP